MALKDTLGNEASSNVLLLHAIARSSGCIFMAVDLCEGSLADENFFGKFNLSPPEKIDLSRQVTEGIAHLHQLGIYHKDLKPSNLLWSKSKSQGGGGRGASLTLKVAYGGITKIQRRGEVHNYLPAEALERIDKGEDESKLTKEDFIAQDMFSLGLCLHFILTGGKHAFGEIGSVMRKILGAVDFSLDLLRRQRFDDRLSNGVCACSLVGKLLNRQPDKRTDSQFVMKHPLFMSAERKCREICESFESPEFGENYGEDDDEMFPGVAGGGTSGDWRKLVDNGFWTIKGIGHFAEVSERASGLDTPRALCIVLKVWVCVELN